MRSTKKIGFWIALAILLIASSVAMNIYLMEHRPVVAQDNKDKNQLCGRVEGPLYCVELTSTDSIIYGILGTSSAVVGIPAILYIIFLFGWRNRYYSRHENPAAERGRNQNM